MKRIKHIYVTIAVLALAGLCFVGCSDDECPSCPTNETPTGSNITIEWMHPQPPPTDFVDLWVAGNNATYMCGDNGMVYFWHGSGWTLYDTGASHGLNGIWGSSQSDIFAVGNSGTIVHYDGYNWSSMQSNVLHPLVAVWGSASNDVYAVGYDGTVLHYNGTAWENVNHGLTTGGDTWYMYDIWGSAANDIFVVGYRRNGSSTGVIWHYDGMGWSETAVGSRFYSVWGTAFNNVFAGGNSGQLYRFDGNDWLSQPNLTGTDIESIWGSGASDIWAVGDRYDPGVGNYIGVVWHFTGISWNDVGGTTFLRELTAVGGSASNDVYVAGYENQAARFNGSDWGYINDLRVTGASLSGIWGFSSGDLWAVGNYGEIVRYDGSNWSSEASGTDEYLSRIWGTDPDSLYAIGNEGTILLRHAGVWNPVTHGLTTANLQSIWGTSASDIWVGGGAGTMLYFNGVDWVDRSVDAISSGWVQDFWGDAVDNYYAIVDGSILRFNGASWSIVPLEGYSADAVHGLSADQVYFLVSEPIYGGLAKGAGPVPGVAAQPAPPGYVFRYNGSEFFDLNVRPEGQAWMHDIWVFAPNNIYILADPSARIVHYNGSAATTKQLESDIWLGQMWGTGTNTIYATGSMGAVIRATAN